MRVLRLAIGVYAITEAVRMNDFAIGLFGGLFLLQTVTNTGCCGTQTCAPTVTPGNKNATETTFEEIKTINHGSN